MIFCFFDGHQPVLFRRIRYRPLILEKYISISCVGLALFVSACGGGEGRFLSKEILHSPDRRYVAVAFDIGGGGGAGWVSANVSIFKANQFKEENIDPGNAMGNVFFCPGGFARAKWLTPDKLLITIAMKCKADPEMFRYFKYEDVDIDYDFYPPVGPKPKVNGKSRKN